MELTLERIVGLAGELEDGERASEQLRDLLDNEAELPDVESLLEEALNGSETYHNRALQDIVNNIGNRLGFDTEYGAYQPASSAIGYDGCWTSYAVGDGETRLVVETKQSTNFAIDPETQPGSYMDEVAERDDLDEDQVYGLIVVGDDSNLGTVIQSIRGSTYRNRIRAITATRLFELLSMSDRSGLDHGQTAQVLLPMDTVNVGAIVGLMNRIIEEGREEGDPGGEKEGGDTDEFWTRLQQEVGIKQRNGSIEFNDDVSYADTLREVIGIAVDEGLITRNDLPYRAVGKSRYLVANEPVHENGKEMKSGHEVRDGFWVECNRSKDNIKRCIEGFVNEFVD